MLSRITAGRRPVATLVAALALVLLYALLAGRAVAAPASEPAGEPAGEPAACLPAGSSSKTYSLAFSGSSTRTSPCLLQGATVSGDVYGFLNVPSQGSIKQVRFLVDGRDEHVEKKWPFDLKGAVDDAAIAWDTRGVSNGTHEITAKVTTSRKTTTVVATVTVDNRVPEPPAPTPNPVGRVLQVAAGAPGGGDGSSQRPYASIQAALAAAGPGDTVTVGPGEYRERLVTVRAGRADAPIRIVGDRAVVRGDGTGRQVEVLHDHITLQRLEIANADKLVWVQHATGVRLLDNRLHDAGGECVRVKYLAQRNELAGNTISRCGRVGFDVAAGKKNGEGIYIGTAPEQLYKNPTAEPDTSDGNWVHHNTIATGAAECVDVKESTSNTLVEHNTCTDGKDPDGSGLDARGSGNTFRYNTVSGQVGAGIRLGGDGAADGINNTVVGNTLTDNAGYGVKIMRTPQATICGNVLSRNGQAASNDGRYSPSASCPTGVLSPA
jgi:hypothetical protein